MAVGGKAMVQYVVGQWVYAPQWLAVSGYHLTYFESLYFARRHLGLGCGLDTSFCIWSCEIRHEVELPPILWPTELDNGRKVKIVPLTSNSSAINWPDGTRMAHAIKILDLIQAPSILESEYAIE